MMEKIKWISIAIVVILVIIIVLQNLAPAETKILFMTIEMPRAALLFGTLAVGYLAGMVIGNPFRYLRRRKPA